VKALGLLFFQQVLCLNAELRKTLLETCAGQRLTARPCSAYFLFLSSSAMDFGNDLPLVVALVTRKTAKSALLLTMRLIPS